MASRQRLNLLVVDRDEGNVSAVKSSLTEEGFQVQVLTDPNRVVQEIKRGRFQLVLLDVSAPGTESSELLTAIRSADSDICVIAMTATPSVEMAVRTLKHQAFDYLQKPLDLHELRQVVHNAVKSKGLLVDLETHLNEMVGARLRECRTSQKLTLKQLANRTGLSVSLISQIELGKSAASMSTLHKLATALQVKMTYFFETV